MARLTDIDRDALGFVARSSTDHVLARDAAAELGWNPRTGGPRFRRLVKLGLLEAKTVKPPTARADRLDGYFLTGLGRDVVRNQPAVEAVPPVGHVAYELLSAGIFGTDDDGPFTIRRVEIMARFPTRAEARAYMIETTAEHRARDIGAPSEGGS